MVTVYYTIINPARNGVMVKKIPETPLILGDLFHPRLISEPQAPAHFIENKTPPDTLITIKLSGYI